MYWYKCMFCALETVWQVWRSLHYCDVNVLCLCLTPGRAKVGVLCLFPGIPLCVFLKRPYLVSMVVFSALPSLPPPPPPPSPRPPLPHRHSHSHSRRHRPRHPLSNRHSNATTPLRPPPRSFFRCFSPPSAAAFLSPSCTHGFIFCAGVGAPARFADRQLARPARTRRGADGRG